MKLSEECRRLAAHCQNPQITYSGLFGEFSVRSHALLTFLLAAPFLTPIPVPGLSVPFGMVIGIAGLRMVLGRGPWIPGFLSQKPLPQSVFQKVFQIAGKVFARIEPWIKPRWEWAMNPLARISAYSIIAACGLVLALPLPPGTNAPPALLVVLFSIALLEDDGLLMSVSFAVFALALAALTWLAFTGATLIHSFGVHW
jgi:hypothetical protein